MRRPEDAMQSDSNADETDVPTGTDKEGSDMFGRKKDEMEAPKAETEAGANDPKAEAEEPAAEAAPADEGAAEAQEPAVALPLKSRVREPAPMVPPTRAPAARADALRRAPDIHAGPGHTVARGPGPSGESEGKRLIVGRDIALNGQINSCEKLIVEGRVEADMRDCREIDIAETGTFKGEAEIEMADISGTFEGTLTARQLLIVRSTGRITGKVRFGQLEIERGGEIIGDVQVFTAGDSRDTTPIRAAETQSG